MAYVNDEIANPICHDVRYSIGTSRVVLRGILPETDFDADPKVPQVKCYKIHTSVGQVASVAVLVGKNTIFSVRDMFDAQDRFDFRTEGNVYEVIVGQLFRSPYPQRFALSVATAAPPLHTPTAQTQGTCSHIKFQSDTGDAVLKGVTPAAASETDQWAAPAPCFNFDASAGKTAFLYIEDGVNAAFTIPGMVEHDDRFAFKTEARNYMFTVVQSHRSSSPQPFKLYIRVQ